MYFGEEICNIVTGPQIINFNGYTRDEIEKY